ncbi:hypothetical protein SG34_034145 [Thalassomonas viridans]|uniref:Uncharacterized protein n=1 Tax=Thalassomonas viridans TaxID=137584 RepID=A0AAF0CE01_9GAMM|nr:hypothetical protein [Thalassomonas viridans]WDE08925.1 hypothetical protein SG34_034145 [Thalassomonas viridans]
MPNMAFPWRTRIARRQQNLHDHVDVMVVTTPTQRFAGTQARAAWWAVKDNAMKFFGGKCGVLTSPVAEAGGSLSQSRS